jgi:hypothetical protein
MFWAAMESVGVPFVIGIIGFLIVRRKVVPAEALRVLSSLALEISLPCLIFSSIIKKFSAINQPDWWKLPGYWILFTIGILLLTGIGRLWSQRQTSREFGASLFYQNSVFVPLVVISQMFPLEPRLLIDLFLFSVLFSPMLFATYQLFFGKTAKHNAWRSLRHPVLLVTFLALLLKLAKLDGYVPNFAIAGFGLVGAMAVPLLLLVLGGQVYLDFSGRGRLHVWEIAKFVGLKNVLFPIVIFAVVCWWRPEPHLALIVLLQSAAPPIASMPILVEREGGNREITCQFVLGGFFFSILSIPTVLYGWNYLYANTA